LQACLPIRGFLQRSSCQNAPELTRKYAGKSAKHFRSNELSLRHGRFSAPAIRNLLNCGTLNKGTRTPMNQPTLNPQPQPESDSSIALPEPEDQTSESPAQKRIRGNAIHRLAKATSQAVLQHTDQIAKALCDRALTGDISSVKLLLDLIEKLPPPAPRKQKSMAALLANSPPWKGELVYAAREKEDGCAYDD
jgi:hypothetical protein